jgi:hypothetical protein
MTIATFAGDLEVRIRALQGGLHPVEITWSGEREFPPGNLDPAALLPWVPGASPAEDGRRLAAALFTDPRLRAAWCEARGQSPARRIRLRLDAEAAELHPLPWELLGEPDDEGVDRPLSADPQTPFSRYLAGGWRPGVPVLERPIRVLAAIAAPSGLDRFGLAALDPEAERKALAEALGLAADAAASAEVELTVLPQPVTLAALEEALRQGPHLLHVVAHGQVNPRTGRAALFLADAENRVALAGEEEIAALFARQDGPLRLVFLACCESATRSPADAFRGLAPALVAAGVPAVLAMQDPVPVTTARQLASTFYRRLLVHGQADLATNEARSSVLAARLPGAAIPVLFQRLRDGRLLGFRGQFLGKRSDGFWTTLLDNIEDGDCTPILGPELTRGLTLTPAELARALAERYGYPYADTDQLPRVAQFVGTLDQTRLRREVLRLLVDGFRRWHGLTPGAGASKGTGATFGPTARPALAAAIHAASWSELSRRTSELEVHHQLADLGLPLYLTTNFDSFMTEALAGRAAGVRREPLRWRGDAANGASGTDPHQDLEPPAAPEAPVVLHLFGTDLEPESMVLTEDDHLDYLARVSRDHEYLLPNSVSAALARTTLLFLGYRLHDLDLKVLLRGLLSHLNAAQWRRLHVAVQVDRRAPDEQGYEEVRRYLEAYFGDSQIDVYWGGARQFVAELHARWQERRRG